MGCSVVSKLPAKADPHADIRTIAEEFRRMLADDLRWQRQQDEMSMQARRSEFHENATATLSSSDLSNPRHMLSIKHNDTHSTAYSLLSAPQEPPVRSESSTSASLRALKPASSFCSHGPVDLRAMMVSVPGRVGCPDDKVEVRDPKFLVRTRRVHKHRRGARKALCQRRLRNLESKDRADEVGDGSLQPSVLTEEEQRLVTGVLRLHFLFASLQPAEHAMLLQKMLRVEKKQGETCVREGEKGDACYIILSGVCSVQGQNDSLVAQLSAGCTFGELAMLYDVPRTATITCTSPQVQLCMIRGPAFRLCLAHFKERCLNQTMGFLNNHGVLSKLSLDEKRMLANVLSPQTFELGSVLIGENISSSADWIYLVQEGTVEVTDQYRNQKAVGVGATISGQRMPYGEKAIVARALTRVRCLAIGHNTIRRLLGNIGEVMRRSTVRSFLESVASLRELTDKQLTAVASLFWDEHVRRGGVVVAACSDPQLVLVMEGEVAVLHGEAATRERTGSLGAPQRWGEVPVQAGFASKVGDGVAVQPGVSPSSGGSFNGVCVDGAGGSRLDAKAEVTAQGCPSPLDDAGSAARMLGTAVLQRLRRGDVFGDRAFRSNCRMDRSLVASTDAVICRAGHDEICRTLRGAAETTPPFTRIIQRNGIKARLQAIFPFSALYEGMLDKVVEVFETVSYRCDEPMVGAGAQDRCFCLVLEGEAVLRREGHPAESLGRWAHFGAQRLLRLASAEVEIVAAAAGCTAAFLGHGKFAEVCGALLSELATKMQYRSMAFAPRDVIKCGTLGQGQFGTVDRVCLRGVLGEDFALKRISKSSVLQHELQDLVRLEREVLSECCHPLVVRLLGTFQDEHSVYFLMENLTGGDLFTAIRDIGMLSEEHVLFFGASIVLAIEYLHLRSVMYRDLKPENVMLRGDGFVKLVDMGACSKKARSYTFVGTPEYMAPEVILGKGYDQVVDWWSVGVIMHEMICGPLPFGESTTELDPLAVMKEILEKPLVLSPKVPPEAGDLLTSLLERSPEQRLGSSTLDGNNEVREHQFFDLLQWDTILEQSIVPPYMPPAADSDLDYNLDSDRYGPPALDTSLLCRSQTQGEMDGRRSSMDKGLATSLSFNLPSRNHHIMEEVPAMDAHLAADELSLPPDPGADLSCFEDF